MPEVSRFRCPRRAMEAVLAWAFALAAANAALAAPTDAACNARVNDTLAKVVECIQQPALHNHLVDLQAISDANPGPDGHGNRDTGQPGYWASVNYVAGLMTAAGYAVTIQPYYVRSTSLIGDPSLGAAGRTYVLGRDWYVARLSGPGVMTAPVRPVGSASADLAGCDRADFRGFASGAIALLQVGACDYDTQVSNAQAAGASGAIIYNRPDAPETTGKDAHAAAGAYPARLATPARIPVVAVAANAVGAALDAAYRADQAPTASLDIRTTKPVLVEDYNVIADAPYGDANHVVVVDGHLDGIYGAGILDNGSGSATMIEVALKMAKTQTRSRLRYIWFGGEEIGLFGSAYYTKHLTPTDLSRIVFDVDVDVTATPNYDILIADPATTPGRTRFPANVVPASAVGTKSFVNYFNSVGMVAKSAGFGNSGTDSFSFSLVGVPNTGILTQQDCCKKAYEVAIWGGSRGNYEGDIPSSNGGCVDQSNRFCDNISNTDAVVHEFTSKAVAAVVFQLANDPTLNPVGP